MLESFNFTCATNDDYFNTVLCSYAGACSEQVLYMPSIYLSSYMSLSIGPQEYLIDNFTAGTCNSLLSTNDEELFILGEPFFRAFNVKLNFNTTEITLFKNNKYTYSPVQGAWPETNAAFADEEPLTMPSNENLTSGGPLYVGGDQ